MLLVKSKTPTADRDEPNFGHDQPLDKPDWVPVFKATMIVDPPIAANLDSPLGFDASLLYGRVIDHAFGLEFACRPMSRSIEREKVLYRWLIDLHPSALERHDSG